MRMCTYYTTASDQQTQQEDRQEVQQEAGVYLFWRPPLGSAPFALYKKKVLPTNRPQHIYTMLFSLIIYNLNKSLTKKPTRRKNTLQIISSSSLPPPLPPLPSPPFPMYFFVTRTHVRKHDRFCSKPQPTAACMHADRDHCIATHGTAVSSTSYM